LKPSSQLDLWEQELETRLYEQRIDRETLIETILETASNGGLTPNNPPKTLWRWNIHRIRSVCMMLEEKGVLVCNEGVYTRNE
jgi:hypothetical protein